MQCVDLPIRTRSTLNQREHWAARHRRSREERRVARIFCPKVTPPCTVHLTRLAPRALDGDNLQGSFKAIRDGIADKLGIDDADARVRWVYTQEKSRAYAVRICVAEGVPQMGSAHDGVCQEEKG